MACSLAREMSRKFYLL